MTRTFKYAITEEQKKRMDDWAMVCYWRGVENAARHIGEKENPRYGLPIYGDFPERVIAKIKERYGMVIQPMEYVDWIEPQRSDNARWSLQVQFLAEQIGATKDNLHLLLGVQR